jgi:hypothetical protein
MLVPLKYIPKRLSRKDKAIISKELKKSRKLYRSGHYYKRKSVSSYPQRKSSHLSKAKQIYNIDNMFVTKELSLKTKCSLKGLDEIVRKGEGAYYSSGSRPNQTPQSWGYARLASAITGGKSAVIDFSIINEECDHNSIPYKLALNAQQIKRRHTRKTRI